MLPHLNVVGHPYKMVNNQDVPKLLWLTKSSKKFSRPYWMIDHRLKICEITDIANISIDCIHYILRDVLGMKKLSAWWLLHLLNADQKHLSLNISQECFAFFKHNSADFLQHFIAVEETWIHHYTSETKQQFKQWIRADESAPK